MNFLANETSPYLRQHKDNPVHWQPWGDAAFEQAKTLNRPVLLSIGYSACHWCHVMAHESFEDEETAGLMNQLFVCIKVDREERPDIDMVYQNALALMGQQGGWPLTMFLTPDRAPFWGGTYFPPLPRHGLPGFREVLRGVHESWREQQDKILHNVQALTGALKKMQTQPQGQIVSRDLLDKIGLYFLSRVDSVNGGIGDAPKFPSLSIIGLLWDAYIRTGSDAYKSAVIQSLTHMCQGGIYDHVGGGFCRYAVDSEWMVPHFEKMLYDNALFLVILSEVFRETQNPLFARRIKETAAWMLRELSVTTEGVTAFASSLDADSATPAGDHAEGAFYVWRSDEVSEILGDDSDAFKAVYDITQGGNWEGVNIPNRLENLSFLPEPKEQSLQQALATLRLHRDRRPAPARDDKVLADWNGLAIAGLIRAHIALDAPELLQAAGSAFSFVTRNMMTPEGRLSHVFCDGCAGQPATLDDYANMAEAALAFFEATHNSAYLAQTKTWVEILFKDYWDAEGKGFFLTPASAKDLPLRPKTADDTATPSGNGTMVGVLARLWLLTGEDVYFTRAEETARAFSGNLSERFVAMSAFLGNCYFLSYPASLVLSGKAARETFRETLRKISVPRLVVMWSAGFIPPSHPAHAHHRTDGPAAAYACFGRTCLAPAGSGDELREILLEERAQRRHAAANDG